MEKLISMVDYVVRLNQSKDYIDEHGNSPYKESALDQTGSKSLSQCFRECIDYANFLKQPITLGMFVPCDLDGNVLDEPDSWANFIEYSDISIKGLNPEIYEYHKAKSRVLFEGFKICNRLESVKCVENGDLHLSYESAIKRGETIEDLLKYNLTLTTAASVKL